MTNQVTNHSRELNIYLRNYQFDLCNRFLCQFWAIKTFGYGCIPVETNIPPGDGLVTVDGYKRIEKWSSASPDVKNIFHQVWLVKITIKIHCACHIGHYYISSSPTWRFHWMIPHGWSRWSIMIVNSTYIYEIINLTCVIDFCVNFDQSNLLGMVIHL